jgi:hypothetical protein
MSHSKRHQRGGKPMKQCPLCRRNYRGTLPTCFSCAVRPGKPVVDVHDRQGRL